MFQSSINGCKSWRTVMIASCGSGHVVRSHSRNTKIFTPFRDTKTDAIYRYNAIEPCVSRLNAGQVPLAIIRFVISIIIDSIDRMNFRWSQSHVSKKGIKTVAPLVAYRDAASAISIIFGIVRIVATKLHLRPRLIFRRPSHSVFGWDTIFTDLFGGRLLGKTTTTERAFPDVCSGNDGVVSTIATAIPHRVSVARIWRHLGDYCQAAKFLSLQVKFHAVSPFQQIEYSTCWGKNQ